MAINGNHGIHGTAMYKFGAVAPEWYRGDLAESRKYSTFAVANR